MILEIGAYLLGQFSATCFYFAASLLDQLKQEQQPAYPIGLIQSAIGGSQIEAWTPDHALGLCKNESLNADGQAPPGRLFNGMVAPFVNISLKGFIWYQGENNCGGSIFSTFYISTRAWPIKALVTLVLSFVLRYDGQFSNRVWLRVPDANDD